MAGNVRVVLKSVWDDSGIKNAQKAMSSVGDSINKAFKTIGVATAAAGVAIGAFAKDSVTAASNLEESVNAVKVSYGDAAAAILKIGENSATSLGVAKTEFNQAAVRFSAFADRVVGSGGDVAGFIGDITQRAADFASVFNIDVSEALRVFQSGLAGEAEPLKRFGINLLESEVKAYALRTGIIKVGESMDETQKVQARYGLLMESTSKTAGDFANTSDGLANSQRILKARFTDLQAEIGTALLPVVTDLLQQVADRLLPKFEELGDWLKSPKGTKAIGDLADAFGKAFDAVFDFLDYLIRNWDVIKDVAINIGIAATAFKTLQTAVGLATGAVALFNGAALANPWTLAGIALAGIATGMYQVYQNSKDAAPAVEAVRTEILRTESAFETAATNGSSAFKGLIPNITYAGEQLDKVAIAAEAGAAEMNRFNNLKLNGAKSQIRGVTDEIWAMYHAGIYANAVFEGILDPRTGKGVDFTIPSGGGSGSGGGGGGGGDTGPSKSEQQQALIDDVNKKIDEAYSAYNAAVGKARQEYADAIVSIDKRYADSVKAAIQARDKGLAVAAKEHARNIGRIQKEFADKQAQIIKQSIDRLRDAYRGAVETNVADLFGTEEVGKSVDNLTKALRDKLNASRNLLKASAELASRGFSQTFIEQVVGAGTETGNELANAILEATPETQSELQTLFGALEKESNTGMDKLAQSIYEKTGLATDELKALYDQTNVDLREALIQAEADYADTQRNILESFDQAMTDAITTRNDAYADARDALYKALTDAATALDDQLTQIKDDFETKLKEMGGAVDTLQGKIDRLYARLDKRPTLNIPTTTAPEVIPGVAIPASKQGVVTQVVNLTVKTDATQSPAQVAKPIVKAINDLTRVGGTGITGAGGGIRYSLA